MDAAIYYLNPLNVWGRRRELPVPPAKSFRQLYAEHQAASAVSEKSKDHVRSPASGEHR